MSKEESKYITKAGLKGKRGWTDLLIKRFLKEPDKIVDNPYYKSMPKMGLYLLEKIDAIELTPEFKVMQESASVRKKSANKAVDTKKRSILEYVNRLEIKLPDIGKDELIKKACDSYNNHKANSSFDQEYDFELASKNSSADFLNRICTNYLRHKCSRYEKELDKIFGKVGVQDAYKILKAKVNKAILEKYTFLYEVVYNYDNF